jgi:hypothetical protein
MDSQPSSFETWKIFSIESSSGLIVKKRFRKFLKK